jgi:hypothetical protein
VPGETPTRLYLSGPRAGVVADLFAGTALEPRVVSAQVGAASAVKMAYAGWTAMASDGLPDGFHKAAAEVFAVTSRTAAPPPEPAARRSRSSR